MWLETWSSSGGFVWDGCKIGPGRSLEFPVDHGKVTHFRRCRFGLIFIFWWVGFCFFWPRGSEMMSVDSWLFIIRPLRLLTLSSLFSGNPMQKKTSEAQPWIQAAMFAKSRLDQLNPSFKLHAICSATNPFLRSTGIHIWTWSGDFTIVCKSNLESSQI